MVQKNNEPNWDGLGDKELASIIQTRTGEVVNPGRMNHANLLAKAQNAFRNGAETKPEGGAVEVRRASMPAAGTDTDPKSGTHSAHPPGEIANSSSGDARVEEQPENVSFTGKPGRKTAQDKAARLTAEASAGDSEKADEEK